MCSTRRTSKRICWTLCRSPKSSKFTQSSKFFSILKVLFPSFGDYELEKAVLKLFMVMKPGFNTAIQTLKILPRSTTGVNSLTCVALPSHRAPRGLYTAIGEECCFYVNQTGQVVCNLNLLKERINTFHQINKANTLLGGGGQWCRLWKNSRREDSEESKGFISTFPRAGKGLGAENAPAGAEGGSGLRAVIGDAVVVEQDVSVGLQLVLMLSSDAGSWFVGSQSLCAFWVLPVIF